MKPLPDNKQFGDAVTNDLGLLQNIDASDLQHLVGGTYQTPTERAEAHFKQGMYDFQHDNFMGAEINFSRASCIYGNLADYRRCADALEHAATVLLEQPDKDTYDAALDYRMAGYNYGMVNDLNDSAMAYKAAGVNYHLAGDNTDAMRWLHRAENYFQRAGDQYEGGNVDFEEAQILDCTGHWNRGLAKFSAAESDYNATGHLDDALSCFEHEAQVEYRLGHYNAGNQDYLKAAMGRMVQATEEPDNAGRQYFEAGRDFYQAGNQAWAQEAFSDAGEAAQNEGLFHLAGESYLFLSYVYDEENNQAAAAAAYKQAQIDFKKA